MRLIFHVLCFIYIFYVVVDIALSELYFIPKIDPELKMKTTTETVPWMGVLRAKHDLVNAEFVSIIILIAKNYAIGCADDINKIEKDTLNISTMVTFYDYSLKPWNTFATNYFVHPEYGDQTINTIALIMLDSKLKVPSFMWQPAKWPSNFYAYENYSSVYNVGYTDRQLILQQVIKRVKSVKRDSCIEFYKREGMNFKKIWPTHYNCFRAVGDNMSCVYEAGMAVASNDSGHWTLIGMGTYGPGCSVPARFIDFFPYIPWIESVIERTNPRPRSSVKYTRRYTWKEEKGEDSDAKLLAIFYNNTIDVLPQVPRETFWNTTLDCPGDNEIMYQEQGNIKLTSPIPTATVFFSVSLFDDNYEAIQCIRVRVDCVQKTKTEVFVQRGFGQEDLEPLIKQMAIPLPVIGLPDKILYITDSYQKYKKKKITTVWFKFNFLRTGGIQVTFFGKPQPITTSTSTTPSTTTDKSKTTVKLPPPTTTRRKYPTYLNWDIYKIGQAG